MRHKEKNVCKNLFPFFFKMYFCAYYLIFLFSSKHIFGDDLDSSHSTCYILFQTRFIWTHILGPNKSMAAWNVWDILDINCQLVIAPFCMQVAFILGPLLKT